MVLLARTVVERGRGALRQTLETSCLERLANLLGAQACSVVRNQTLW